MLLSRGCEYGLQAVLYLASRDSSIPILQREISQSLRIPNHFLGKILQVLVKNGILLSYKGKTGGFSLAKNSSEIFPLQIIQAIDGENLLSNCILGFSGCSQQSPCPLHEYWKNVKQEILFLFQSRSIFELSRDMDTKLAFISEIAMNRKNLSTKDNPSSHK